MPGRTVTADICVYGGTSGGVVAAVQAARLGRTAVIVEPGKHLGGMTAGGLSWTDVGNSDRVGAAVPRPYPIGYGAIVPQAAECGNLFVTFALSASHVAFGSIRMEPVFMTLSQSAATAASLAIEDGVPVQKVSYPKLRERLLAGKVVLEWKAP